MRAASARLDVERLSAILERHSPNLLEAQGARAAVAAIVRDRPEGAEVLLIQRAQRSGDPWSGHMAFPGGRQDESDVDSLHTAQRETLEEVGLDLTHQGRLLGRLDDLPAIAKGRQIGITITPYVFELLEEQPLVTNEEVAEILWAPLTPLLRGEQATTIEYYFGEQRLELPAWEISGKIVWGLTHRMLQSLLELASRPLIDSAR